MSETTSGITTAARGEFAQWGVLQLKKAFDAGAAARMRDAIWRHLEQEHGVRADDPSTWTIVRPAGLRPVTRTAAFVFSANEVLYDAIGELVGPGTCTWPERWGPLVTFPSRGTSWSIPNSEWHLDFPARGGIEHIPGIRILGFLERVESRGGGTLVVAGSHRLVGSYAATAQPERTRSRDVRDAFAARYPWFADLWSKSDETQRIHRLMVEGASIQGVEVRVHELTGEVGDVFLMHPWTMHAASRNCSATPRFMVNQSVIRGDFMRYFGAADTGDS